MNNSPGYIGIFLAFLKMGATAFGGNVAMVAAIRREVCEKRKWIADETILDLMVIGNVVPGPLATNVVFACGKILRGIPGAFVALIAVIIPSFILMCFLSWAYFTIGTQPAVTAIMNGMIPCVAAIIAATGWSLYRRNVKHIIQHVLVLAAIAAMLIWHGFFLTMIIVVVSAVAGRLFFYKPAANKIIPPAGNQWNVMILPAVIIAIFSILFFLPEFRGAFPKLKSLALTFGSMSVTLFGGGYVFIPAMQKVVVNEMMWLTSREFSEGIALGQITPGPIMISSVFIGWKVAGLKGAATAAISLFLPPAVIMYVAHHFIIKIKANRTADAALSGVRPAVIGMIFASVWTVFRSGSIDYFAAGIFVLTFAITVWKNPEPILLIIASGIAGWFIW